MTAAVQPVLVDTTKRVKAAFGKYLSGAILFGSYARGEYDTESDIDIALLFDCTRSEVNRYLDGMAEIAADIGLQYGVVISFVGIPLEEYEKWLPTLPFYQSIAREGVRLIA